MESLKSGVGYSLDSPDIQKHKKVIFTPNFSENPKSDKPSEHIANHIVTRATRNTSTVRVYIKEIKRFFWGGGVYYRN